MIRSINDRPPRRGRAGFVAMTVAEYQRQPDQHIETDWEAELDADIAEEHLPAPEKEYRFTAPRRWRFDRAWPSRMLAVEVEGATWVQGRHTTGAGFERDCEKYNAAALLGWMVLRVTGNMIRDGRAVALVRQALEQRPVWLPEHHDGGAAS